MNKIPSTLLRFFGLHLAINVFGNCFKPAICFNFHGKLQPFTMKGRVCYPSRLTITLRDSRFVETVIHWRGGLRFDWNSAHIARKFGKLQELDFGDAFFYEGILGSHCDV